MVALFTVGTELDRHPVLAVGMVALVLVAVRSVAKLAEGLPYAWPLVRLVAGTAGGSWW